MREKQAREEVDLAIVGAGLAGRAAALFAAARGMRTALLGQAGMLGYATGFLDLLSAEEGRPIDDPLAGIERLRARRPAHPLARIGAARALSAMEEFVAALNETGLSCNPPGRRNISVLLPTGMVRKTLCAPRGMRAGGEALRRGAKTLIIDFEGVQGFSAREFAAGAGARWPALRTARIAFGQERAGAAPTFETMARALEAPGAVKALAERIGAVRGDAACIGLPAMLGMSAPEAVRTALERRTGAQVFEIPTVPPAVPGLRLQEATERVLARRGVLMKPGVRVRRIEWTGRGARLFLSAPMGGEVLEARAVLLATGRFASGGLWAGPEGVRETLLGLPVSQPRERRTRGPLEYPDPRGEPLNAAGVETDEDMRPAGAGGRPENQALFAAGTILAHQDWTRQRCGAGLSMATAHVAVEAAARFLKEKGISPPAGARKSSDRARRDGGGR